MDSSQTFEEGVPTPVTPNPPPSLADTENEDNSDDELLCNETTLERMECTRYEDLKHRDAQLLNELEVGNALSRY